MRDERIPRLLFVCAEFYPLAKTGGLADVCAALPRALAREGACEGHVARIIRPYRQRYEDARVVMLLPDGGKILLARAPDNHLPLYLFPDQSDLFRRPGGPYQDPERRDWPDNHLRYAAFCRAATVLAMYGDATGWNPASEVHAHDWHTLVRPAGTARSTRAPRRADHPQFGLSG